MKSYSSLFLLVLCFLTSSALSVRTNYGQAKIIRSSHAPTSISANHHEAFKFLEQLRNNSGGPLPVEIDWRKHGRVTSVKDQGSGCSAGWAFSAVGALEGQQAVRFPNRTIQSLSAQNLLDCSVHRNGCVGGSVADAMENINREGGIELEQDYEYTAAIEKCRFNKSKSYMTVNGAYQFWWLSMEELQNLVANFGPVALTVASSGWNKYKTGVFSNEAPFYVIDHHALLVGYGTDPHQGDYWILKNSWSDEWGEAGYIRVRRSPFNCGIGSYTIVPKFVE